MATRRKQVLQLLAEGHSMKEVGAMLAISQRTVALHKYEIMREQNLRSNADVVMFAIKQRILQLPVQTPGCLSVNRQYGSFMESGRNVRITDNTFRMADSPLGCYSRKSMSMTS